jgi:hypothetical protein
MTDRKYGQLEFVPHYPLGKRAFLLRFQIHPISFFTPNFITAKLPSLAFEFFLAKTYALNRINVAPMKVDLV